MVEQVIYARDTRYQPLYQYYSLPTSCVGGAPTMPAARASYHAALADVLGVDEAHLPKIVEHVEIPVVNDIWLRTVLDERGGRERNRGYLLLQDVLPRLDDVTLKEFHDAVTSTGAPVLVLVLPDDPMSLVLDQMSVFDAVWVAFPTPEGVSWAALYRAMAGGVQASDEGPLDANLVRDMSVRDFMENFVRSTADGVDVELGPHGATRIERPARAKQVVVS
ncbi:hypothetical protein [Mycobacterium sp. 1245805.9]|uniref:hypothetical protein n=1 Tax=Mycobacterium sp. 1245805.9 TaxID=1856862 RepID=UPI0007FF21EF|nr:hypothetical protein [Mycobacterium sp. 1245805.9]OBI82701.1 hypothetical protein A9X00_07070 [Mycobacterium sp. 1245805.9]